jgi:NAD(P)-dependent dehydrogenase (short-subunit alcohol dehydrogenase family)
MENVLIIGASSSIGNEISSIFRDASMRVITTYSSTPPTDDYKPADVFQLDLAVNESIETFTESLKRKVNKVDIAIFLAGILPGKQLATYKFSEIDDVISVNFNGQAKLIQGIFPLLSSRSRLLLFSSISGQRGSFDPVYAASKGALLSLVKSLIFELPRGARINAIAPGLIQNSAMFNDMTPERQEYHRNQIPSKRLLDPKDLAKIVFDLCQDHWQHMNGSCVDLNGGQYVR